MYTFKTIHMCRMHLWLNDSEYVQVPEALGAHFALLPDGVGGVLLMGAAEGTNLVLSIPCYYSVLSCESNMCICICSQVFLLMI